MNIHIPNLIEGFFMNKSLIITMFAMSSSALYANVTANKETTSLKNSSKIAEAPTKGDTQKVTVSVPVKNETHFSHNTDKKGTQSVSTTGSTLSVHEVLVDLPQITSTAKMFQDAQQEVKQEQEKGFKRIQQSEQEFVKAQKELESKIKTLSPEAQAKEQKKLVKMQRDGEELVQNIKEEIQMLVYKKTEILDQELLAAAKEFAQLNGFDVVKDKTTGRSLYVAEHLDSSAELTKLLDAKYEARLAQNNKNTKKLSAAA